MIYGGAELGDYGIVRAGARAAELLQGLRGPKTLDKLEDLWPTAITELETGISPISEESQKITDKRGDPSGSEIRQHVGAGRAD